MKTMFDGKDADGQSDAIAWSGGAGTLAAWGTWDSGTVTLQASFNGGTYVPVAGISLTANGTKRFQVDGPCTLRLDLAGSTSPDLDAVISS